MSGAQESSSGLYGWLEQPLVYRASQRIFGAGAERSLLKALRTALPVLGPSAIGLDVGCGPQSLLRQCGLQPVCLDLNAGYLADGSSGVAASACRLPFADASFDLVWSCGLLHHLSDAQALQALQEMRRVLRPGAQWLLFDAIWPNSAWSRPLAYTLRRLDRGRHVRSEAQLRVMLESAASNWQWRRMTYTVTGLEGVMAAARCH